MVLCFLDVRFMLPILCAAAIPRRAPARTAGAAAHEPPQRLSRFARAACIAFDQVGSGQRRRGGRVADFAVVEKVDDFPPVNAAQRSGNAARSSACGQLRKEIGLRSAVSSSGESAMPPVGLLPAKNVTDKIPPKLG